MTDFTPLPSLAGGLLIGLAASLLLYSHGRIAGVSGVYARMLTGARTDPDETAEGESTARGSRWSFIAGLVSAGFLVWLVRPELFPAGPVTPLWMAGIGGFLVGFGTRLGNGCTSGHGVCGVSRLSARSIVATVTFIAFGALTVLLVRSLGGV